jgi:hypothetical protein
MKETPQNANIFQKQTTIYIILRQGFGSRTTNPDRPYSTTGWMEPQQLQKR